MKKIYCIIIFSILFFSCKKEYKAPVPNISGWDLFENPSTQYLKSTSWSAMEGIYKLTKGNNEFGDLVALKWSFVIEKSDTTFHLSGFFGKDIAYFICEGKILNGSILLNGYWRKMVSVATGIIRLTIKPQDGAKMLLSANPFSGTDVINIEGLFGNGQVAPNNPIQFIYYRKLNTSNNFRIMSHRSGGRTSDLLPSSENSIGIIKKTAEFGSTGIEIDVRLTKDGIPILYHDNTLNTREVQKSGLLGPIENYTFNQLSTFVRLIDGEKIPTLREALKTVIYQTPLTFVWLDTKYTGPIEEVRAIQKEYLQLAAAAGRQLEIVIGLPTDDAYQQFIKLPAYKSVPSLSEQTPEVVQNINAKVWAPRFTLGTQNELVNQVHANGKLAFVWTLDVPEYIERFINDGHFDAILSNYPSCVAYYYYVHQ